MAERPKLVVYYAGGIDTESDLDVISIVGAKPFAASVDMHPPRDRDISFHADEVANLERTVHMLHECGFITHLTEGS